MKLVLASTNKGKLKEINSLLAGLNLEIKSLSDFPEIQPIAETGSTFEENAFIKAKAVYDIVNMPVLSDDSGLIVDCLKGEPGVYSARYAGENATDLDNCKKLLKNLNNVPFEKRTARFKCIIVFYTGGDKNVFEGTCEGHILDNMKGTDGFGYDPLFQPEGYSQSFGEIDPEEKNKISHRGKALQKLVEFMQSSGLQ